MLRRAARSAAALAGMAVLVAACSPAASRPALATAACGRRFRPGLQHDLQNVAAIVRKTYQIPGIAVAVTVPGEGCWVSATGLANTAGHVPLTPDDAFPIGSITKTFTATVILQLVQQGKLSLSAPVSRWVPYVRHARQITVRMLLQMTSGIANEPRGRLFEQMVSDPGRAWTPQQVVRLAVAGGAGGRPGRFSYSNTNYIILGMIARAVTGQPIQELISNRILRPLHLRHTSFRTAALPRPVVQGYVTGLGQVRDITAQYDSPAAISAAGAAYGMTSTVGDLQVWARALATGSLLSAAVQSQRLHLIPARGLGSFRPLPGTPGPARVPQRYGLGVAAVGRWLGHDGSVTGGYTADMFYLPARRATIVVLVNGSDAPFGKADGEAVSDAAAASIAQIVVPGGLR